MTSPIGGYLIAFDESQRNLFLSEVRGVEDGFSDALSRDDWPVRQWEVCGLLFEPGHITHWALARRGNRVATGKVRVEFTEVTPTSIRVEQIKALLPSQAQVNVISARSGAGGGVTSKTWGSFKEALGRLDADSLAALERLERMKIQSRDRIIRDGSDVVAQERDALGIALDAFDQTGNLRKKVLRGWVAPEGNGLTSFLDGLEGVRTIEDQLVARDAAIFPGTDRIRLTTVGAVFSVGTRVLEVFNLNRSRVESATGADLLYFNEEFDAWTLIQYKLMERNEESPERTAIYRPDENFDKELQRMNSFREELPDVWTPSEGGRAYRLCGDGFYFKFCSRVQLEVLSDSLLPGMYLPREFLTAVLDDPELRGERGGRMVTFDNTGRHLTNTLFAELLREGWVGTRGASSQKIAEIVKASLNAGHSISLARARPEGAGVNLDETLRLVGIEST